MARKKKDRAGRQSEASVRNRSLMGGESTLAAAGRRNWGSIMSAALSGKTKMKKEKRIKALDGAIWPCERKQRSQTLPAKPGRSGWGWEDE